MNYSAVVIEERKKLAEKNAIARTSLFAIPQVMKKILSIHKKSLQLCLILTQNWARKRDTDKATTKSKQQLQFLFFYEIRTLNI